MQFEQLYDIILKGAIFLTGIIIGRLSMAIQYAVMKDISKKKKD